MSVSASGDSGKINSGTLRNGESPNKSAVLVCNYSTVYNPTYIGLHYMRLTLHRLT